MAAKRTLLSDFLGENVYVLTDSKTAVSTQDGDIAELTLTIEGVMLDFDDQWVILNTSEGGHELIRKDCIVSVRVANATDNVLADAPDRRDMN